MIKNQLIFVMIFDNDRSRVHTKNEKKTEERGNLDAIMVANLGRW